LSDGNTNIYRTIFSIDNEHYSDWWSTDSEYSSESCADGVTLRLRAKFCNRFPFLPTVQQLRMRVRLVSEFLPLLVAANVVTGLAVRAPESVTIIQGNDDGWGAAYIRALYQVLIDSGYKVSIYPYDFEEP
jgi:hypothetical protein